MVKDNTDISLANLSYDPSHRQDSIYHDHCYTSCGALAGMRNRSMGQTSRIDPMTHSTMSRLFLHASSICKKSCITLAIRKEGRKEMFYLMMHSTHFIYSYMASDIW